MSNELTAMQQYTAVLSDCISSQEKWLAFLDFAADFSMSESQMKHGFSTQIGVYGSPLRSAVCLTEDDWAKYERYPVTSDSGISVLSRSDTGTACEIRLIPQEYTEIFDEENAIPLPEYTVGDLAGQVQSALAEEYDLPTDMPLANTLREIVYQQLANIAISHDAAEFAENTMMYQLCKRYGIQPDRKSFDFSYLDSSNIYDIGKIGKQINQILFPLEQNMQEVLEAERSYQHERETGNDQWRSVPVVGEAAGMDAEVQAAQQRRVVEAAGIDERTPGLYGESGTGSRGARGENGEPAERRDGSNAGGAVRAETVSSGAEDFVGTIWNSPDTWNGTGRRSGDSAVSGDPAEHQGRKSVDRTGGESNAAGRKVRDDESRVSSDEQTGAVQGTDGERKSDETRERGVSENAADGSVTGIEDGTEGFGVSDSDGSERLPENRGTSEQLSEPGRGNDLAGNRIRIIGNTDIRNIPNRRQTQIDADIAVQVAEQLESLSVLYSCAVDEDLATITVSKENIAVCCAVVSEVYAAQENVLLVAQAENPEAVTGIVPPVAQSEYSYELYQLRDDAVNRQFMFLNYEELQRMGGSVKNENYAKVYSGEFNGSRSDSAVLEELYYTFNMQHPNDFTGRSMSVSDIVVLNRQGERTAYFTDSFGYKKVPEFLQLSLTDTENVLPVAQTKTLEPIAEIVLPVAQSEPMPCYLHDFTYAKEHDEVDAYKRNAEENRKCIEAISKAISDNYDISKYSFDSDTAWNTLTESFAPERITMILSANIARIADFDGRISQEIKAWAKEQYALIPEEIQKSIQEFTLNENPGLLDIMGRHIIDVLPVAQSQEPPKIEAATDTDAAAKKKAGRRLENRAYKALQKLAPEMFGDDCTYLRFESKQHEPLVIEKIDTDKISIAHYYEQNGDLMRDPEIVFTVDDEAAAIYPLEFTQDNLGIYEYYASYDRNSRDTLSFFTEDWSPNLEKQNHSLAKAIYDFNGSDVTVYFRPDGTISGADADNPEIAAAFLTSRNFSITDEKYDYRIPEDSYGIGTKRDRCHDNIEAIRTLKAIEADERMATPEEQKILAKYVGWGGIQEVFDANNGAWKNEYAALRDLLSKEEYRAAEKTITDAFYTSPVVSGAIYEALENMGFHGGRILEPSMGVGNFFGTMPESMRNHSKLVGVEIDSITGRIAKQLYQSADIHISGIEQTKFTNGSFDVAVGNVPFGDFKVNDRGYNKYKFLIHDYFFAKALDKVKDGGIVAFVTSSGTMDKQNNKVRQYLAERADLIGAIRLPNNAFSDTWKMSMRWNRQCRNVWMQVIFRCGLVQHGFRQSIISSL